MPGFPKFWEPHEVALPRWAPIHIGSLELDLSPTKHVVMLLLAASLACLILIGAARAHARHTHAAGHAEGVRRRASRRWCCTSGSEVALPNLGHHGEAYVPFILTLFFFILFANLLGLIPYGSTATGNISVTATLAIITFVVVEIAGMRAQGLGYLNTIFYWNKDLPLLHADPDVPHHDADRDHRKAHEAVRARDPSVRQHDGGPHRRARAHRADLHVQELR